MKKNIAPRPWLFPRPVLLLTTRNDAGKDNIMTVSWAGVACTRPPMVTVSLRKSRQSHRIVQETKEFVINIPTSKQVALVELCGTASGRNTDKFAALELTKSPASRVAAPLIVECPINLECQVRQTVPLGSHVLFVAEVLRTHVQHALLHEDGEINDDALDCLAWGAEEFHKLMKGRKQVRPPSL
jgi:flavin reductase (DIM6/NTAB) family NADH-FMN oxidoreductase RutF